MWGGHSCPPLWISLAPPTQSVPRPSRILRRAGVRNVCCDGVRSRRRRSKRNHRPAFIRTHRPGFIQQIETMAAPVPFLRRAHQAPLGTFPTLSRAPTLALFHSPPQQESPIPVTDNLYRECGKEQARHMREGSTNKFSTTDPLSDGSGSEAKSLFRNILAVSHYGSGFCPGSAISNASKFLEMNILGKRIEKNIETYPRLDLPWSQRTPSCGRRNSRGRLSPYKRMFGYRCGSEIHGRATRRTGVSVPHGYFCIPDSCS